MNKRRRHQGSDGLIISFFQKRSKPASGIDGNLLLHMHDILKIREATLASLTSDSLSISSMVEIGCLAAADEAD